MTIKQPYDLEFQAQHMLITPHSEFDRAAQDVNWAFHIMRSCPGPLSGITIDLRHVSTVSSGFFAGALTMLEHYKTLRLQQIELTNVADRILRTLEIMNMREAFIAHPANPADNNN